MVVAFKPLANNFAFSTNSYTHRFDVNFFNFGYGAGCTVSNIVMEISTSKTPGSGTNNTVNPTVVPSDHGFVIHFTSVFATMWGGVALASDNTWATN